MSRLSNVAYIEMDVSLQTVQSNDVFWKRVITTEALANVSDLRNRTSLKLSKLSIKFAELMFSTFGNVKFSAFNRTDPVITHEGREFTVHMSCGGIESDSTILTISSRGKIVSDEDKKAIMAAKNMIFKYLDERGIVILNW